MLLPGGLQLLRSQRGECLMAGVGKPFLAEGRIPLSGPIASLGVCVNLGVSQQQCGKEIMWLQTEENEPGWCWSADSFPFPTHGLWMHGIFFSTDESKYFQDTAQ